MVVVYVYIYIYIYIYKLCVCVYIYIYMDPLEYLFPTFCPPVPSARRSSGPVKDFEDEEGFQGLEVFRVLGFRSSSV